MPRRIKIKAGNTTVNMDNQIGSIADNLLNNLLPDTKKAIDKELEAIEKEARSRWLVREKNSKGSREKLYSEIYITPDFKLIGVVGNKAEYAWAILVGKDAQNTKLKEKQRLSHWLLWTPMKKASNKFAALLAEETTKIMRKNK